MKRQGSQRRIGAVLVVAIACAALAPANVEAASMFRHVARSLFDCPGPGCPADIVEHKKGAKKGAKKAAEAAEEAARDIERAIKKALSSLP